MSRMDDELERQARFGRWSFSVVPLNVASFQANSLLYTLGPAWASRSWTINLNKMTYQSGPLDPTLTAFPLDNQVAADQPQYQARVVWGVDGVLETAVLDWPWAGGTLCVQGATVRVDVLANLPQLPLPTLSGSLTPVPPVQTAVTNPVLTLALALAVSSNGRVAVPARATAYRYYVRPTSSATAPATGTLTFQEEDATATVVKFDGLFPDALGTSSVYSQQNQQGYIPLARGATFVRVFNTSATVTQVVSIQFLLDMG